MFALLREFSSSIIHWFQFILRFEKFDVKIGDFIIVAIFEKNNKIRRDSKKQNERKQFNEKSKKNASEMIKIWNSLIARKEEKTMINIVLFD